VGSIGAGVPERLLKNQGALAYPILRSQCIDLIQQEGFESKLAQWAVDSWAIGFKIIERTDTDETTGRMSITSTPAGGKVYLDDKLQGKAFLNLSAVPAGTHTLKCTLDGYQNWEQTIEVNPGELTGVIVTLTPKPVEPPKPNAPTPSPQSPPLPTYPALAPSPKPLPITQRKRWGWGMTIAAILILGIFLIGGLYFLPHDEKTFTIPVTTTSSTTLSSSLELVGNVYGISDVPNQVNSIKCTVALAPGVSPLDMTKTTIEFSTNSVQEILHYQMTPGWMITEKIGGNQDDVLQNYEQFVIILKPSSGLIPNTRFDFMINNPSSVSFPVTRTIPTFIDNTNILY
jgi:hypothetical protein